MIAKTSLSFLDKRFHVLISVYSFFSENVWSLLTNKNEFISL